MFEKEVSLWENVRGEKEEKKILVYDEREKRTKEEKYFVMIKGFRYGKI